MNKKLKTFFTATSSLLLLSTFVMGNNYVAHDYLHGRGDAAISIALLAGLICLFLALYFGYNGMRSSKFVNDKIHGVLREDKAPPEAMVSDSHKSREELREEHKLRQEQQKEDRRKVILQYVDYVMVRFFNNSYLDLLGRNIRHWHFSDESNKDRFMPKPLPNIEGLTSMDIRHFVWNIGERLDWEGIKRAQFAKFCFPEAMKDLEVETIRRTLKQSPTSPCTIDIDEPDSKGDYHFHYSEYD